MARRSLNKQQVDRTLNGIKVALGHLSRMKIGATESAGVDTCQVMLYHSRVSRMVDYMQLSSAASEGSIEIDLTDHDDNLVASCLVSTIGKGEVGEMSQDGSTAWSKELAQALAVLTLEFANRPIEHLPGVPSAHCQTRLVQRIMQKIEARVSPSDDAQVSHSAAGAASVGVSSLLPGTNEEGPQGRVAPSEQCEPIADGQEKIAGDGNPVEQEAKPSVPEEVAEKEKNVGMEDGFLLDPSRIQDPRLRKMLIADMRGLHHCRKFKDYRIATVHLCAILEQVTLEHAIGRESELGLAGPIDSWRLPVILIQLLGDDMDEGDRALLRQILTSRNLLYPAIQLLNPRQATADSFEEMLQLTRQLLACLSMNPAVAQRS